jgi:hypothetical protein
MFGELVDAGVLRYSAAPDLDYASHDTLRTSPAIDRAMICRDRAQ